MHCTNTILCSVLWPIWLYQIPSHYLMKRQNFQLKDCEQKSVTPFVSTNSVQKFSHSEKNSARYYYKFKCVLSCYSWQILVKYEFSPCEPSLRYILQNKLHMWLQAELLYNSVGLCKCQYEVGAVWNVRLRNLWHMSGEWKYLLVHVLELYSLAESFFFLNLGILILVSNRCSCVVRNVSGLHVSNS